MQQMQSVTLRSRVDQDGFLKVHLPEMIDQEVEAIVVYQLRPVQTQHHAIEQFSDYGHDQKPKDLYGICANNPIILDDGGIDEQLDDDLTGAFD